MSHDRTVTLAGVELNVTYMIIWAVLLGLTLVEVFIPEFALSPFAKEGDTALIGRNVSIAMLIGLAIAKTYCVAWFYMHLIDERPLIVLIGCTPFIFSVFLTIGLFPW